MFYYFQSRQNQRSQSSSLSLTNISVISEGPNSLENATTSLIPAPPQILRKRPEIVRPQYKFSLDQCEESIRRQKGFIQAKRVSMYHQYQNGNYGNPNGHFMPVSYNYSNSSNTSLVDNNSSDYYSYHTKGYFVYRQLNQGGIDIGSVVSDCYIAKPRLPFDGYSDQDTYSRRDGQVSFRNQGLQPFLKSGTSLNTISDEEYIALNIVGVRLRDLLQTNGAFHGALEMVREISGKYIQPYTNSVATGSEYSKILFNYRVDQLSTIQSHLIQMNFHLESMTTKHSIRLLHKPKTILTIMFLSIPIQQIKSSTS